MQGLKAYLRKHLIRPSKFFSLLPTSTIIGSLVVVLFTGGLIAAAYLAQQNQTVNKTGAITCSGTNKSAGASCTFGGSSCPESGGCDGDGPLGCLACPSGTVNAGAGRCAIPGSNMTSYCGGSSNGGGGGGGGNCPTGNGRCSSSSQNATGCACQAVGYTFSTGGLCFKCSDANGDGICGRLQIPCSNNACQNAGGQCYSAPSCSALGRQTVNGGNGCGGGSQICCTTTTPVATPTCHQAGGGCSSGSNCCYGLQCISGHCQTPTGGTCTSGGSCAASNAACCSGSTLQQNFNCGTGYSCTTTSTTPTSCNADSQCPSNKFCSGNGTCQPDRTTGGACNRNTQCQSNFCNTTTHTCEAVGCTVTGYSCSAGTQIYCSGIGQTPQSTNCGTMGCNATTHKCNVSTPAQNTSCFRNGTTTLSSGQSACGLASNTLDTCNNGQLTSSSCTYGCNGSACNNPPITSTTNNQTTQIQITGSTFCPSSAGSAGCHCPGGNVAVGINCFGQSQSTLPTGSYASTSISGSTICNNPVGCVCPNGNAIVYGANCNTPFVSVIPQSNLVLCTPFGLKPSEYNGYPCCSGLASEPGTTICKRSSNQNCNTSNECLSGNCSFPSFAQGTVSKICSPTIPTITTPQSINIDQATCTSQYNGCYGIGAGGIPWCNPNNTIRNGLRCCSGQFTDQNTSCSSINLTCQGTVSFSPAYTPSSLTNCYGIQLQQSSCQTLGNFIADSNNQGYNIYVASGYRSYQQQSQMYNDCQTTIAQTNNQNACQVGYPGCSEHQSGQAVDLYIITPDGNLSSITPLTNLAHQDGLESTVTGDTPHFSIQ